MDTFIQISSIIVPITFIITIFVSLLYLKYSNKKEYIKIIKCGNPSMCNCIDCGESDDFCDYHKDRGNQILKYTFYRKRRKNI